MRFFKRSGALALTLAAVLMSSAAWADNASPVGLWKNVDDVSGKPRALIRVTESNGTLQGKIEKVFPGPSEDRNPKCEKCEGALKNQPVIGLPILSGLKKEGAEYTGGKILDPDNGKVYRRRQEAQRARLHWRVNAGSFADLGAPGIEGQARLESYATQGQSDKKLEAAQRASSWAWHTHPLHCLDAVRQADVV